MSKLFRTNKKGFTLIELIVVIAILAILAAIAIPSFMGITDEADAKVALANARNIATGINAYNNLNPDAMLDKDDDLKAVKDALTAVNLWPIGLDKEAEEAAWDDITFTGNVAIAAEKDSE